MSQLRPTHLTRGVTVLRSDLQLVVLTSSNKYCGKMETVETYTFCVCVLVTCSYRSVWGTLYSSQEFFKA